MNSLKNPSVMPDLGQKIWRDKTFGNNGYRLRIFFVVSFYLPAMFVWTTFHTTQIYEVVIGGVIFLTPAFWITFYFWQIRHVLQEVEIDDLVIRGRPYFGRRISFRIDKIRSVDDYKMTWVTRNLNFLDRFNPGIDITLTSGETWRVSHKMERFPEMKETLIRSVSKRA